LRGQKIPYQENHRITNEGEIQKKCNKHHILFPNEDPWMSCTEEYFYKTAHNKRDGLRPDCKECTKINSSKWLDENKDIRKVANATYAQKPKVKKKRQIRDKKRHSDGYFSKYQQDHKEQIGKYSKYKQMNATHNINKVEWESCLKYFDYSCAYCGLKLKDHYNMFKGELRWEMLHKEHVIHNGSNRLDNCAPACKSCNSQKWEFEFDKWYKNNINYTQERYDKINQWLNEDHKLYIQDEKTKKKYKWKVRNPINL